ncbi:hypothetical protein Rs2_13316 [Raphanus sativus]|nr:hypothetical protein Rs2_13316 [Raphanus sativus]
MNFEVTDLYSKPHDKLAHQKSFEETKGLVGYMVSLGLTWDGASPEAASVVFEDGSSSSSRGGGETVRDAANVGLVVRDGDRLDNDFLHGFFFDWWSTFGGGDRRSCDFSGALRF